MCAAQAVPDATDFFTFLTCVISGFCRKEDERSTLFWEIGKLRSV
jgi:hypothetical protein